MQIVKYEEKYLKEILDYQKELYEQNFKNMSFDEEFYDGIKSWYDEANKDDFLYAYAMINHDKVKGFYLFVKESNGISYLMQFYISPDFRKKGYGKMLFEHYEKESRELDLSFLLLHVSSINERAVDFYSKNGFYLSNFEYDENEDIRFVMAKRLT